MDEFAREIQALDRAVTDGKCRELSAAGISRLAERRRKKRAVSVAAGIGVAMIAIYGLGKFSSQPHHRPTPQFLELNAQLAASIKATTEELEQSLVLRRETETLLAELQRSSASIEKWNDPVEEAAIATLSYARQMLDRGASSSDVREELDRLRQLFPGTAGAKQAEELATVLARPVPESNSSSSRTHAVPAWNQIAKEL